MTIKSESCLCDPILPIRPVAFVIFPMMKGITRAIDAGVKGTFTRSIEITGSPMFHATVAVTQRRMMLLCSYQAELIGPSNRPEPDGKNPRRQRLSSSLCRAFSYVGSSSNSTTITHLNGKVTQVEYSSPELDLKIVGHADLHETRHRRVGNHVQVDHQTPPDFLAIVRLNYIPAWGTALLIASGSFACLKLLWWYVTRDSKE